MVKITEYLRICYYDDSCPATIEFYKLLLIQINHDVDIYENNNASSMAMINIEYIHTSDEEIKDSGIRRPTVAQMKQYIRDLLFEMQMGDISCKFIETVLEEGPNDVLINGMTIPKIIDGLQIKMLEMEDSCDSGTPRIIEMGRPTLDWKKEYIEDIPDTIMKNAIAKVYADMNKNNIDVIDV